MAVTITHTTPADGTFSATGAAAWDANHAVSGLGTMAEQDANNVNITGGSLSGVTGVATSGTNSNITSLTGLTTPLSVAQGGSGTATPALVAGTNITLSGTWPNQTINATVPTGAAIGYTINGQDNVIVTGVAGTGLRVPFGCTINSVTLLANLTGSIVIDIWKDTYANFPPTVADSICASAKPTITASNKSTDTTLTGWTKTITAGDVLYFNVDSCSTITNCVLILGVTKT